MNDYELWTLGPVSDGIGGWSGEGTWTFLRYRRLSLSEVLRYESFGYVVRKVIGDRSSTVPLFPLLGQTGTYPTERLD